MSLIFSAFSFLAFSVWAFTLFTKLNGRMKKYAFISSVSLIALILYYATFRLDFQIGQTFIYLVALILFSREIHQSKGRKFFEFLRANRTFFSLSLLYFIVSASATLATWDEFFLASFAKHLNRYGSYWSSGASAPGGVQRWGLAIWENFFLPKGHYFEGSLFFAVGLILFAGLGTISNRSFKPAKIALSLFLFACAVCWFTSGLNSIYVDLTMSVLMATSIMAVDDSRSPIDLAIPVLIAMLLAVVKETGPALALVCLACVFFRLMREKEFAKKWIALPVAGLGFIAFDHWIWQRQLAKESPQGFHPSHVLDGIMADFQHLSQRTHDQLNLFSHALISRAFPHHVGTGTIFDGHFDSVGTYVFWAALLLAVFICFRKKYEILASFVVGLLGYTLLLMTSYVYYFGDYEGSRLTSFERYFGMFFLAFALVAIKMLLESNLLMRKKFCIPLLGLIILYPPSLKSFLPTSSGDDPTTALRKELGPLNAKIIAMTPENSRIWYVWQNSSGIQIMIVRYEIAPRTTAGAWSLGAKYDEGDAWTSDLSVADVIKNLADVDYVAIGKSDDQFLAKYGNLFAAPPLSGRLFKKTWVDGNLKLLPLESL